MMLILFCDSATTHLLLTSSGSSAYHLRKTFGKPVPFSEAGTAKVRFSRSFAKR